METATSSFTEVKKKPGPKAAPKIDVKALQDRIENLENLVIRMAHNAGVSHTLIIKAGLLPFEPTAQDMTKFNKIA